jgi:hypothetical protein
MMRGRLGSATQSTPTPAGGAGAAVPPAAQPESPTIPPPQSTSTAATSATPAPPANAAARSAAPGAAPPAAGATTVGKPSASPSPAAAGGVASKPADDSLVTFPDAKLYDVTGKRATDRDAVLNFVGGQLLIMPRSGGVAMATLPYSRIRHATYVRAREPKWDKAYASPPADLDIGSVMGALMRTSRHWLVLQGTDHYEILRLDDANFAQVLGMIEARTGIKIDRPK